MECPKETWFDEFTNILSRIPDYRKIAEDLHAEFKLPMKDMCADTMLSSSGEWVPECDSPLNPPQSKADEPTENNRGTCNSKDTQDEDANKSSPGQPMAQATAITNVQIQTGSSIDADTLQEALSKSSSFAIKYAVTALKLNEVEKHVLLLERDKEVLESTNRELESSLDEHKKLLKESKAREADLKLQNVKNNEESKVLKKKLEKLVKEVK